MKGQELKYTLKDNKGGYNAVRFTAADSKSGSIVWPAAVGTVKYTINPVESLGVPLTYKPADGVIYFASAINVLSITGVEADVRTKLNNFALTADEIATPATAKAAMEAKAPAIKSDR